MAVLFIRDEMQNMKTGIYCRLDVNLAYFRCLRYSHLTIIASVDERVIFCRAEKLVERQAPCPFCFPSNRLHHVVPEVVAS